MSRRAHACLSGTVQVQDRGVAEEDAAMVLDSTAAISSHEPVKMAELPGCGEEGRKRALLKCISCSTKSRTAALCL